jgi:hypothetical protein
MVSAIGLQFGVCRVGGRGNGDLRATRLTAFELKRILGSEIEKRIVYFETRGKLRALI